ncbi:penicillin-binding protein 2 [Patescibacteria group bacterium]|nr:penicillin-binding protein 2 [Patescibacteria group bacterium]
MRNQMILRVRVIALALVLVALGIICRLYFIQVHAHEVYVERAERQYVHTVRDLYTRGSIFFTTKDNDHVSAASVQQGYVLALNPTAITDAETVCATLKSSVTALPDDCVTKATVAGRAYVELVARLSTEDAAKLKPLKLEGVQLYRNQWRYYPGNTLASRMLGFVGYTERSETELHGKYGLERQYDHVLFRPREVSTVNLFAELFSNLGDAASGEVSGPGDIILTVEPTVAHTLDKILKETNDTYKSELTGAIIMDPKTGAIYAMSVVPNFDLNDRGDAGVQDFKNVLVEDVYEFGSTIKALTVAAGLDSRAITRTSTYFDPGCIELNTKPICNYDKKGRGTVDMQEVLSQSLNTGVTHIVTSMGRDKFRDYFLNFKLGSESGIDLPNEAKGLVENLQSPRDVEYATASFGQGIAVSPIAATRALAALGNGGYLVTPHLVSGIKQPDGTTKELRYPEGAQVLRPETSEEISRILTNVVDDALLGGTVALPHHTIAAKTGTAQMSDSATGKYSENDYLHSFFGYFPAYEPRFLVFMYTVKPQGVRFASETLTLPFMDIAKFLINYYSIPPDR